MINTNFFEHLSSGPEYTVIYTTTPVGAVIDSEDVESVEPVVYDAEFDATEHLDLKRDFRVRADNSTNSTDTRPLFEKYQFFTPGLSRPYLGFQPHTDIVKVFSWVSWSVSYFSVSFL
jgi:hypothetical protein